MYRSLRFPSLGAGSRRGTLGAEPFERRSLTAQVDAHLAFGEFFVVVLERAVGCSKAPAYPFVSIALRMRSWRSRETAPLRIFTPHPDAFALERGEQHGADDEPE